MIKHKIVTEGLVRKEKGTSGVGVFKVDISNYIDLSPIQRFQDKVPPVNFLSDFQVGMDFDAYTTALELSGDIPTNTLLVLNCKKASLLKADKPRLYRVVYSCRNSNSSEEPIELSIYSARIGEATYNFDISVTLDDFLALKVDSEGELLLDIHDNALFFYYNVVPYFTKSIPVTLEDRVVKRIEQGISKGAYAATERLAQEVEPNYMASLDQPHIVFYGHNISAGTTTDTYILKINNQRLQCKCKLSHSQTHIFANQCTYILLVLDSNGNAALYY